MYPVFFFFNDTATTEIYTLSLHDALPIWTDPGDEGTTLLQVVGGFPAVEHQGRVEEAEEDDGSGVEHHIDRLTGGQRASNVLQPAHRFRSEEHTSELQSQSNLVCRLLLEK